MTIRTRHRITLPLTASFIAVAIVSNTCSTSAILPGYAQNDEASSIQPDDERVHELSARELELRRKEEELLQVMSGAAPSRPASEPVIDAGAQAAEPAGKTIEVETRTVSENTLEAASPALKGNLEQLRALEQHPALDGSNTRVSPPPPPSNTVRTYRPDGATDGTTAQRLGTFTRVKRPRVESIPTQRETARTKMVSLSEIEQEASIRNVSYTVLEPATIRTPSVHLKTGPTKLDTSLLVLPQYSEVTIDYRSGSWYRVKTNSGIRGWVPGTALLFDAGISERSAVRIGAVDSKTP